VKEGDQSSNLKRTEDSKWEDGEGIQISELRKLWPRGEKKNLRLRKEYRGGKNSIFWYH